MSAEQEIFNEFRAFGRGMSSLLRALHRRSQGRQRQAAQQAHLRVLVEHFVRERLRDSRRSDPDLDRAIDRHNPPGPDHDRRFGEQARDGVNGPDPQREAELDRERDDRDQQREDRDEEREDREDQDEEREDRDEDREDREDRDEEREDRDEEREDRDEEREDRDEEREDRDEERDEEREDRDEQRDERQEEAENENENENDDSNQPQAEPELDPQQDLDPGRDPEHEREKAQERERDRERDDLAPDAVDPALAAGAAGAAGAATLEAQSELENDELDEPARTESEQETSGPEADAPDQVDRDITAGPEAGPLAGPDPQAAEELRDAKVDEAQSSEPPAGPDLEVAGNEPASTEEARSETGETVDRTQETEREFTELESDPVSPYASDETKLEAETETEVESGTDLDSEYDADAEFDAEYAAETDYSAQAELESDVSPYVAEETALQADTDLGKDGVNPYVSDGASAAEANAVNKPGQPQLAQTQPAHGQQATGQQATGQQATGQQTTAQQTTGQQATAQQTTGQQTTAQQTTAQQTAGQQGQPVRSAEMTKLHEMGVGGVSPAAGAAQPPGQAPAAQSHAGTTPGAHHQRAAEQAGKQQQAGKEA